jgi:hypothetical protein
MERSLVVEVKLELPQEFSAFAHRLVAVATFCCCKRLIGRLGEGGVQCDRSTSLSCGSTPGNATINQCLGRRLHAYPQQFGTRQHAFFHAHVQKVYVIPQKLVSGGYLSQFRL